MTTVHGFRYLVDDGSRLDRVIWGVVIFSGFVYAAFLIYQVRSSTQKKSIKYKKPKL